MKACLFWAGLVGVSGGLWGEGLPLDGFADCIHHWQNAHHMKTTPYPRLAEDDVAGIAETLMLYQRANGGWKENEDPLRILSEQERAQVQADKGKTDTSLDNRNGWPQVEYLAGAYRQLGKQVYREAARRGLAFLLESQTAAGGFPHTYPSRVGYHPYITFADDITPDVLRLLRRVSQGAEPFGWVEAEWRQRAAEAVERGNRCLLQLQIRQGGRLTVWAGQYDPETLVPVQARAFELPALVSRESVPVVKYLMELEHPSPEVRAAVEAAIDWYRSTALKGWRIETVAAEPVKYTWHTSTTDRRLVADPQAPALWARFYTLEANTPLLVNRDGKPVERYEQIERERRTGYEWYGTWPQSLLDKDYPAWKQRWAP